MSTACGGAESAESAESGERANSRSCALSRLAEAQPRRSRGAAEVQPRCVKLTSALAPPCGARGRPRAGRPGRPQCRTWARPGRRACARGRPGKPPRAAARRPRVAAISRKLGRSRLISRHVVHEVRISEVRGMNSSASALRPPARARVVVRCVRVRACVQFRLRLRFQCGGLCAVWRGGCVRRGMAAVWHPRRWSGQSVPPSGGAAPRPRRRR